MSAKMPYPIGDEMAVGLYSTEGEIAPLCVAGWNVFQSYASQITDEANAAGAPILGSLPGASLDGPLSDAQMQTYRALRDSGAVAWWDLPEERNYTDPGQLRLLQAWVAQVRAVPSPLPTYMYIPGDYDAEDVAAYLPLLDVIPAAIYPRYQGQPHAWTRWRMETTIRAILDGGAIIGRNYRAGEKTPVAVLELFSYSDPPGSPRLPLSAAGSYHDFWQAIVSGARGILVYSYGHRDDDEDSRAAWSAIERARSELLGPERLDRAFLDGEVVRVEVRDDHAPLVISPLPDDPVTVSYPAVDVAARQVGSTLYAVVVNSAEDGPVMATLSGLPHGMVDVLFRGETLPATSGSLTLEIEPLGVRILKMRSASAVDGAGAEPAPVSTLRYRDGAAPRSWLRSVGE